MGRVYGFGVVCVEETSLRLFSIHKPRLFVSVPHCDRAKKAWKTNVELGKKKKTHVDETRDKHVRHFLRHLIKMTEDFSIIFGSWQFFHKRPEVFYFKMTKINLGFKG